MLSKEDMAALTAAEDGLVLKVRLTGTKNDIKWFRKILQRNPKIEVTEFSDLFLNKGTKKFGRISSRWILESTMIIAASSSV